MMPPLDDWDLLWLMAPRQGVKRPAPVEEALADWEG